MDFRFGISVSKLAGYQISCKMEHFSKNLKIDFLSWFIHKARRYVI